MSGVCPSSVAHPPRPTPVYIALWVVVRPVVETRITCKRVEALRAVIPGSHGIYNVAGLVNMLMSSATDIVHTMGLVIVVREQ